MRPKELSALHAKCFETPRPWSEAEFKELLSNPQNFVCERPNGFAFGRLAGPEAEVLTLAVDPKFQRQGIGAKLVQDFEIAAKNAGVKQLFLEVAADNPAAIALYQSAGFTEAGIRKSYYSRPSGQHVDALVLSKSVSAL